ncbi:MAG: hypothetical protein Q7T36_16175 [Fluviicoccus sp.]|uniref:hypothetical protein n=1 Tax=Fluviicoccus sp. TaxID=2003552 RepID=UPI002719E606|nr:hypothetical protein [Fluviicoccus sp.]MDO8332003.1 hypothetical protein [Fluviicoccus sp.]
MNDELKAFAKVLRKMPPPTPERIVPEVSETLLLSSSSDYRNATCNMILAANEDRAAGHRLIEQLKKERLETAFRARLTEVRSHALLTIGNAFGVGTIVSALDKHGGPVDTLHNAESGVYASEDARQKFESRPEKCSKEYYGDKAFIDRGKDDRLLHKKGELIDRYTGKPLQRNANRDLDHVIPIAEIHNDPKVYLAGVNPVEMANSGANLVSTHESANKSKKDKTASRFASNLDATALERQSEIAALQALQSPSDAQRMKLKKLQALDAVDGNLVREVDQEARADYESRLNKAYYLGDRFPKEAALATAKGAANMGLQQAFGLALCELVVALMDEAQSIWQIGFKGDEPDQSFLAVLKIRLLRVANRVGRRWKDVLSAFMVGGVSGLFSSITTIVINTVVTTSKRIIRLLREGAQSFLHALKTLVLPPQDMTMRQAAHEATKILVAGVAVSGGLLLEEYIQKALLGLGVPFSNEIATVLLGLGTGLATAILMVVLDRVDLYGHMAIEERRDIDTALDVRISSSMEAIVQHAKAFG